MGCGGKMRGGHGPRNPFFIHFLSLAVYLTQRESWWSEKSPQGPSHKTCLSMRWDFDNPPPSPLRAWLCLTGQELGRRPWAGEQVWARRGTWQVIALSSSVCFLSAPRTVISWTKEA